jgi:hypothetical protein
MPRVHRGLGGNGAIRLQNALGHGRGHFRGRVADVDLSAGDVVRSPFERYGLGEAGDRMFRRAVCDGVWPWDVCRKRPVVDDPTAPRPLILHRAERTLCAQEGAGEVGS